MPQGLLVAPGDPRSLRSLPSCLPDASQKPPRRFSQTSGFHSQDSTFRIPQPGFHGQDSTARIPQPRFHSQDSTARIPQLHSQDSIARIPQPGFHSQDSTARIPQPGFHNQGSTLKIPQPGFRSFPDRSESTQKCLGYLPRIIVLSNPHPFSYLQCMVTRS